MNTDIQQHYPYGIYNATYVKNQQSPRTIISFGGKKVLLNMNLREIPFKLGFFTREEQKHPKVELLFHTTDDIDILIRRLKILRKQLVKRNP